MYPTGNGPGQCPVLPDTAGGGEQAAKGPPFPSHAPAPLGPRQTGAAPRPVREGSALLGRAHQVGLAASGLSAISPGSGCTGRPSWPGPSPTGPSCFGHRAQQHEANTSFQHKLGPQTPSSSRASSTAPPTLQRSASSKPGQPAAEVTRWLNQAWPDCPPGLLKRHPLAEAGALPGTATDPLVLSYFPLAMTGLSGSLFLGPLKPGTLEPLFPPGERGPRGWGVVSHHRCIPRADSTAWLLACFLEKQTPLGPCE